MQDAGEGRANLTNTIEYDAAGQLAKATAPDGRVSEYGYDANGDRVLESVTAGGVTLTTRTVYDAMRRVVRVTGPDGLVTAYEHDALGRVVRTVADAEGEKIATLNAFDAAGRLVKTVADAGGANESATSYAHDANGNVLEVTDATGRKVKFAYDALNRRVSVTDALGNTARAAYDANGRQTSVTDANGRAKTTAYDLAGRPTEQANEMGQKTRYGYDKLGNRVSLTDANGNVTRWTFDVFGRETSMTFPNGDKEIYEYDRLGRMTAKTKPDGTVIRYEYDRLGRLVKIVTPDGEIIYEYDAWGRVAKEVSPTRTLTCEYDRLGRLIAVTDSFTGKTVRYAYNRLGAREKTTLDGIDVTYKYDRLLRLSEVQKTGEAAPAQYEYDPAGRRTALKLPNGVKTTYAHDAAGRLTRIESKNAAGNVISAFGYALDATGNRTAMDVTLNGVHNRIEYAFDNAYRLTRETRKDAAGNVIYDEGLTYDPVGNRLTRNRTQIAAVNGAPQTVTENTVYAYNAANQLVTETTNGVTTAYGYDKNGNNTTIAAPAANGNPAKNIAMTYDWLNRQTKWTDGERTESTVFAGADWKRASTTVTTSANGAAAPPSIVKYLYDGDNVLADYDASNALTAFYVTPGLDQNLSITSDGHKYYYSTDGLGSVRTLTDAVGVVKNTMDYTAFGETYEPNTGITIEQRYGFTGRERSSVSMNLFYRYRSSYIQSLGIFTNRNPWYYIQGRFGLYDYVSNDPVNYTEPFSERKKSHVVTYPEPKTKDGKENEFEKTNKKSIEDTKTSGTDWSILEVKDINDANKKVKSVPCKCVETLEITGHGNSWKDSAIMDVGSTNSSSKDKWSGKAAFGVKDKSWFGGTFGYEWESFGIDAMFKGIDFCESCTIILRGCSTGKTVAGKAMYAAIATKTGCKVQGFDEPVYAGKDNGLPGKKDSPYTPNVTVESPASE